MNHPHLLDEIKEFPSLRIGPLRFVVATILKESDTMWRGKAIILPVVLAAGCAASQERQSVQTGGGVGPNVAETELVGCLLAGAAPGTFVLADVAGAANGAVDVMSTRIGLTAYLGRRVAVRGNEETAPRRSIHEGARLFRIRELAIERTSCSG
jgi:hypothetical protein